MPIKLHNSRISILISSNRSAKMYSSLSIYRLLRTQPRSESKWKALRSRLQDFPEEVMPLIPASCSPAEIRLTGGDHSSYPLHDAIKFGVPVDIIEEMIRLFPAALNITDDWDNIPLQVALALDADYLHHQNTWRILLEMLFEQTFLRLTQSEKRSWFCWPTCISWDSFVNRRFCGQLDLQLERVRASEFRKNLKKFVNGDIACTDELRRFIVAWKIELRTFWRHRVALSDSPPLLHACVMTKCNVDLTKLALKLQPQNDYSTKSDSGDLPLHLASANILLNGCWEDFYENDGVTYQSFLKIHMRNELLENIVSSYNHGARVCNKSGLLPLHIALHNGKTWRSGVSHIAEAFPTALEKQCPESFLLPFMIAATNASDHRIKYIWSNQITEFTNYENRKCNIDESFEKNFIRGCVHEMHLETFTTIYTLLRLSPTAINFSPRQ